MDTSTIETLGMFAKDMLGDERFQTLCGLFSQQMATDMLGTQPHETKKREGIHAAYVGFNEFLNLMAKFANDYDTVVKATQLDYSTQDNDY